MNVRLSWVNSTPGARQKPLEATIVSGRSSPSFPFVEINRVPVGTAELVLQDVAPGSWEYQAVEVDVDGRVSSAQTTIVAIEFEPPTGVTNFTAVEE
jgi:hypothetical protein